MGPCYTIMIKYYIIITSVTIACEKHKTWKYNRGAGRAAVFNGSFRQAGIQHPLNAGLRFIARYSWLCNRPLQFS
jgi:hypothetical protein